MKNIIYSLCREQKFFKWQCFRHHSKFFYRVDLLQCMISKGTIVLVLFAASDLLGLEVLLYNRYQYVNDLDFQSYNGIVYAASQADATVNSDDTYQWATSTFYLGHLFKMKQTQIYVQAFRSGFWGRDNLQAANGNALGFSELYLQHDFSTHTLILGRQRYQIDTIVDDYIFNDTLDALRVVWQHPENPNQAEFLVDILGNSVNREQLGIYAITNKDDEVIDDFRGDTISARLGFNVRRDLKNNNWIRSFFYGVRYGANNRGGADLARNGLLARNQSDEDSMTLAGLRVGSIKQSDNQNEFRSLFTIAYSDAKDRTNAQGSISRSITQHWHGAAILLQFYLRNMNDSEHEINLGHFAQNFIGFRGSPLGESLLYGPSFYPVTPYAGAYHFIGKGMNFTITEESQVRYSAKTFFKLGYGKWSSSQTKKFSIDLLLLWQSANSNYLGTEITLKYQQRWEYLRLIIGFGLFFPQKSIAPMVMHGLATAKTLYLNFDVAYDYERENKTAKDTENIFSRYDDAIYN